VSFVGMGFLFFSIRLDDFGISIEGIGIDIGINEQVFHSQIYWGYFLQFVVNEGLDTYFT
jgi:hypothetical protein